ncbi:hypothetical protein CSOJ01_02369 [Colletotrichum sojae]|uniref:Uncharacterized protein n=1 Tax=Colletotrichum sojae TaxID=2175907 RepID=A0A8H6JQZ7_9PEZI|nr:hypothetical protein CSOJ01_02369 [Colletotrichum sojae]
MWDEIIPDMPTEESKPYCICVELASEETYRKVFRRYPNMRYQVGRACAAAGYDTLYFELDLLPDVSVAEEAREANNPGSKRIFDSIMSQPVRYAVMNDYTRTINVSDPQPGACLNADTAIRASLLPDYEGDQTEDMSDPHYFDIDEDLGPNGFHAGPRNMDHQVLPPDFEYLLWSPLPRDLPTTRKDPLIVMAAYEANLDRYLRLRRPVMVAGEEYAVIRGIYHNTTFAKWWSLHAPLNGCWTIELAITARFIMNNDLSRISPDAPDEYCADDVPDMSSFRVAQACIAANYQDTYDALDPDPHRITYQQARQSHNPHYVRHIERRNAESGVKLDTELLRLDCMTTPDKEPSSLVIEPEIRACWGAVVKFHEGGIYPRDTCINVASWEHTICVPEELKRHIRAEGGVLYPESVGLKKWKAAIARRRAGESQKSRENTM